KDAKFQPVAVEAVATAFVKALTEPRAVGKTYDLCGDETFTLVEMIDVIARVMGKRRLKIHVPNALARFQARLLEWIFPALLGRAPSLNRDQLIMLGEDNVGDGRTAKEMFGLEIGKFEEGIAAYVTSKQ